jgi:hypothetical protein
MVILGGKGWNRFQRAHRFSIGKEIRARSVMVLDRLRIQIAASPVH